MLNFWVRSGAPFRLQRRAYNYVNISAKFSQDHQVETPSISGDCHDSAEKKRPKLPPEVPSPDECCGTGCNDCIFLRYAEDLLDYYKDGGAVALQEIDKIADLSVRMFVKTEIDFYIGLDENMREVMKKSRKK